MRGTAQPFTLLFLWLPSGWLSRQRLARRARCRAFDNNLFFRYVRECTYVQTAPKFIVLPCVV